MIVTVIAMGVMLYTGRKMTRYEGGLLLMVYTGFIGYLVWQTLGALG